jgi:hypothetical protein
MREPADSLEGMLWRVARHLEWDSSAVEDAVARWEAARRGERPEDRETLRRRTLEPRLSLPLRDVRRAHDLARSVARVETEGKPVGTGFVVERPPARVSQEGKKILLTGLAVFAGDPAVADTGPHPESFAVFGDKTRCRLDLVFQSAELGIAAAELEGPPRGLTALPVSDSPDEPESVYLIGYPGGRLSFSLHANRFLERLARSIHYVAKTAPGSTGSPVFDGSWNVIGVHLARRDDGVCEATPIPVVLEALGRDAATRAQGEGAKRPIQERNNIVILYNQRDKEWCDRIETYLEPLEGRLGVAIWGGHRDDPKGGLWAREMTDAMERACLVLVLVSHALVISEYFKKELSMLDREAKRAAVPILWVPIRPAPYESTLLTRYQAVHDPGEPLSELPPGEVDGALKRITARIEEILGRSRTPTLP